MKHLFIGGFADGMWINVRECAEIWSVPSDVKAKKFEVMCFESGSENKDKKIKTQDYKRVTVCEDNYEYYVYAVIGDHREVLKNLIQGYEAK